MSYQFQALLFFNNSPDGRQVDVTVEGDNILVHSETEQISLPIGSTDFKLGGDNNSYLIATGKDISLFIKDGKIFEKLIEKSDSFQHLHIQHKKAKHATKRTLGWVLAFTGVFLLTCYISLQGFIYVMSKNFPVSWEEKIGNMAVTESVKGKSASDKSLVAAVENIGNYLHENSGNKDYKIKYFVVKDDTVNAFALPGGFVVVNTGLIQKSDSPEEVAAVIAHELNHVYEKHSIERIMQRFGSTILLALIFGDLGGLVGLGGELAGLKFDRGEESEADRLGLELLYKSGIDPNAMVSFFKKLQEIDKDLPNSMSFLSTHPLTSDRIKDMQSIIQKKYTRAPFKKFAFNWQDIKAKAKRE